MKKNLMLAVLVQLATIAVKVQENNGSTKQSAKKERTEQKAREMVDNNLSHAIFLAVLGQQVDKLHDDLFP